MFTANSNKLISKRKSLSRWQANIPTSHMTEKERIVIRIITIRMAVAAVIVMETLLVEDVEEAAEVAAGEDTKCASTECRMLQLWQEGPLFK
jgi:hypothetical protein